ncbi:phage tail assembly chaperone [Gallibacterium anatis]|uniref:phage tail assembly chaperone n=1 Tax=Gallibacterium anatis TaxID=750 RepID=UPI00266FA043|nr:hypothetical protein [Gallibacterium anatis]WKS98302.1 hypothetical protein NYR19_05925 [Gallibacterium anatis]
MSLKTKEILIESGRDKGTKFIIEEMPIAKADKWAMKLFLALSGAGFDTSSLNNGMVSVAGLTVAVLKNLPEEKVIALADELLECVKIVPDGGQPRALNLNFNDIQDVTTLFKLRMEVLKLHIGFLLPGNTRI